MRYLFPSMLIICGLLSAGPACSQNLDDPFCTSPAWTLETPSPLPAINPATKPPATLTLLTDNSLTLHLNQRARLAFDYQFFSLPEGDREEKENISGQAFFIGLYCLFD